MAGIEDQLVEAFRAGLAAATALHTSDVMTKAEANYRPCDSESMDNCCGDCSCYSDGACSIVSGKISENMTCDEFTPGTDSTSSGEADSTGSSSKSTSPVKPEDAVTGG